MARSLISLGKDECMGLADEDPNEQVELTCRFCDRKEIFTKDELSKLFD